MEWNFFLTANSLNGCFKFFDWFEEGWIFSNFFHHIDDDVSKFIFWLFWLVFMKGFIVFLINLFCPFCYLYWVFFHCLNPIIFFHFNLLLKDFYYFYKLLIISFILINIQKYKKNYKVVKNSTFKSKKK